MIAQDLALALDPVALARAAGFEPDAWQADVLRTTSSRLLLNCCRQSGKSTTAATLAVWTCLYDPGALVLLLSPSERQSGELFKKALTVYRALGRPVPATSETALTLTLANGSRIVSLPGSEGTIRGYSGVRLLVVDEASRVDDSLYHAVRPMLAVSGGRLAVMSTPFGRRGFFYREWAEGAGWQRVTVPATACPRISPAFLEEERRSMPAWFFDQEYGCTFSDNAASIFPQDLVLAAGSDDLEPLFAEPSADGADDALEPLFEVDA